VTWNQATAVDPWGTPGAEAVSDRDSLELCTFNAGSTGPVTINLNTDGIALVQSWVDGGAANNGIIIADPVSTNGADFDSSESATAMSRPRLEITYTVAVVPPNQLPTAAFTADCTDLDCSFTDTSTDSDGSITGWSWDFDDGNNSSAQNPNHSFAAGGSYTVSLTVTDDGGETDMASSLVTVTPPNQPPSASFNDSCTDLNCGFADTSTDSDGSITAWAWDFGDSNGSSVQNPPHSFAADGSYTVELTVTDNEGATDVTSKLVTVSEPPLVTDVVANADIPGAGTVSGSYTATQTDNGVSQSTRERESGGKKQNRYSYFIHTWQTSLPANAMATVYANAWSGGSSDDSFVFSWSTDNDTYTDLFTVSSTDSENQQSAILPGVVDGTVYIRVKDSDQTPGHRNTAT
jgi:PKD repeat protein